MPWLLRTPLLLILAAALAGCSDAKGGSGDPDPTPTETSSLGATSTGPAPDPVAPLELANETLDFAAANGGAVDSLSVEVPATHGNVTVRFQVYADCPTGYATSPRLVMEDADGTETQLWAYEVVVPDTAEPYTCPAADPTGGRERQAGNVGVAAVAGTLTLRTEGEFTGEVDVVVIVSA